MTWTDGPFHAFWKKLQDKLYPPVAPRIIATTCIEPEDPPVKEQTFPKEPESTPEIRRWCEWYAGLLHRGVSHYVILANMIENDPSYREDLVGDQRLKAIAALRGQADEADSIAMDLIYRHDPETQQDA